MSAETNEHSFESATGVTERALEMTSTIQEVVDALEATIETSYIDGGHAYTKSEIIEAVRLAESEGTAEIPTLYKVPGLQEAVTRALTPE